MTSDILRENVGQETETALASMNIGQFSMLLDDVSVIESLIPQGDHMLTLKALVNLIYHEAAKRSIDGYEQYADKTEQGGILEERQAKALLDNGLAFNKRGEVVPIFPQT